MPYATGNRRLVLVSSCAASQPPRDEVLELRTIDQDRIRSEGLELLRKNGWEFPNSSAPFPSMSPGVSTQPSRSEHSDFVQFGFKTLAHHVFYLSSTLIGYCIIAWSQFRVMSYINLSDINLPREALHSKTRRANAEVNRALVALVCRIIAPTECAYLCQFRPSPRYVHSSRPPS